MKKRTSIKKRSADDQIIRRKGKVRIINKKTQDLNKFKDK